MARELGEPGPTVAREAKRLLDSGLLVGENVGRSILLRPNPAHPATAPLRQLLVATYGPAPALEEALGGVDGIDQAFVHGSWAARRLGETGKPPGDIDLLVVGNPQRDQVDHLLDSVEAAMGREVNVTYASPERWEEAAEPFLAQVRGGPLVPLRLPGRTAEGA
jgi:hypothetical protein